MGQKYANISDLYKQVKLNEQEIIERKLTPQELEDREKIAKKLPMADFKKRYGKDAMAVKMATATNIVKKKSREEGFKSDAQRRAAFAQGYKAKGKKGKKEETELDLYIEQFLLPLIIGAIRMFFDELIKKGFTPEAVLMELLDSSSLFLTIILTAFHCPSTSLGTTIPRSIFNPSFTPRWTSSGFVPSSFLTTTS